MATSLSVTKRLATIDNPPSQSTAVSPSMLTIDWDDHEVEIAYQLDAFKSTPKATYLKKQFNVPTETCQEITRICATLARPDASQTADSFLGDRAGSEGYPDEWNIDKTAATRAYKNLEKVVKAWRA